MFRRKNRLLSSSTRNLCCNTSYEQRPSFFRYTLEKNKYIHRRRDQARAQEMEEEFALQQALRERHAIPPEPARPSHEGIEGCIGSGFSSGPSYHTSEELLENNSVEVPDAADLQCQLFDEHYVPYFGSEERMCNSYASRDGRTATTGVEVSEKDRSPNETNASHFIKRTKAIEEWPCSGRVGLMLSVEGMVLDGLQHPSSVPGAREALLDLQRHNIPYLFVTNSTASEESMARQLSQSLDLDIQLAQVVVAHSPMQWLARKFGEHPILVVGADADKVLRAYGFRKIVCTAAHREQFPTSEQIGRKTSYPYHAIIVLNDLDDWKHDLQVCLDVLLGSHLQVNYTIPMYFSHADLFQSDYPGAFPRLGLGNFYESLARMYLCAARRPLKQVYFYGKPRAITFEWSKLRLLHFCRKYASTSSSLVAPEFFMVGCNIMTDIVGANANVVGSVYVDQDPKMSTVECVPRVSAPDDKEYGWYRAQVAGTPGYVCPDLRTFVDELLTLPRDILVMNEKLWKDANRVPNPVALHQIYGYDRLQHISNAFSAS